MSRTTAHNGTFQPMLHRSGTLRERLHSYTKRTLGAGGSINEAVRIVSLSEEESLSNINYGRKNAGAALHLAEINRCHGPFLKLSCLSLLTSSVLFSPILYFYLRNLFPALGRSASRRILCCLGGSPCH